MYLDPAVPGDLFGDDARMKILRNKRYQELLLAEQKAKDLGRTISLMSEAEIYGEQLQREWDRTLGKYFNGAYGL